MQTYRVGAVAYHPRVVTIWEGFRAWFQQRGLPAEYVLHATYDQQLEALFAGTIDVAWNTNLAYGRARERSGGACRSLAMRDTDRDWRSHAVVPDGAPHGLDGLRGKRVGFGDADSPQAYILPAYHMRRQGLDPFEELDLSRLDRDVGKHGDTGGAELVQLERLRSGELDACILSDPTLEALRADGRADGLAVAWTTPPLQLHRARRLRCRPCALRKPAPSDGSARPCAVRAHAAGVRPSVGGRRGFRLRRPRRCGPIRAWIGAVRRASWRRVTANVAASRTDS